MLYVLHGNDFDGRKAKKDELLSTLKKKRPDAEVFTLESEDLEPQVLDELLGSQGLFESKNIILGKDLFAETEVRTIVQARLEALADSPNVFLFEEGKLQAATVKKVKKHAESVFGFEKAMKSEEGQNRFAFADALGRKNKKDLWVEYQKALYEGSRAEELHGLLFWQVKSMILAKEAKSPEEAGMKPFPYKKSKQFANNFNEGDLENFSKELVALYHDAHRGYFRLKDGLEKWILDL